VRVYVGRVVVGARVVVTTVVVGASVVVVDAVVVPTANDWSAPGCSIPGRTPATLRPP
jgi:hypothetical protein